MDKFLGLAGLASVYMASNPFLKSLYSPLGTSLVAYSTFNFLVIFTLDNN